MRARPPFAILSARTLCVRRRLGGYCRRLLLEASVLAARSGRINNGGCTVEILFDGGFRCVQLDS